MEKTEIQSKIAELMAEHAGCIEPGHMLCIIDRKIMMIHNERTNIAPLKITKLSTDQIENGLTPDEWSRITTRTARLLDKLEEEKSQS